MSDLQRRAFGDTGLIVSALGLGAGQIGEASVSEGTVETVLNAALDAGITLIDTARGYFLSEERIGRYLAGRRQEFILSTKVGYGIPGYEDWTGPCITAGIDAALGRLRTDVLDIVHLHSCPRDVLERGEVVEALNAAVGAGKIRVAAYSGDNDVLDWAVASGRFGSVQLSVNVFDQRVIEGGLASARERGLGVIAKRPVANAPWRFAERPVGHYCEEYWARMKVIGLDPGGMDWDEYALRFSAYLPGVHCAIVGTASPDHLRRNLDIIKRGPLPAEAVEAIQEAFRRHDNGWTAET